MSGDKGFSIVEYLIAITLGALVVTAVTGVYLSNKTTFNIQNGLSRLQENARFANHIFNKDVRMAGFQGCNNLSQVQVTNLVTNASSLLDIDKAVSGFEATSSGWSPSLPTHLSGKVKAGTDVIEVRMASPSGVHLTSNMTQPNTAILVTNRLGIQAGEVVLITDCEVADLFVAGANSNASAIVHTVANNTSNDLTKAYQTDAQILRFHYFSFYIKDSGRSNANGETIYSLFRQNVSGVEEEIAEGVEDMQLSYGIDTTGDGNADSYLNAASIETANQWPNVLSVSATKLFNTIESFNTKAQSYTFNGASSTPGDRMLRREWGNYISLRNRGL